MPRRFALEAVFAGKGDALILHHGAASEPRWSLIDGGHKKIYANYLLSRLNEIRVANGGRRFRLDPVILSHADEDHLYGLLEMFRHLDDDGDEYGPFPATVENLWMNSFHQILAPDTTDEVAEQLSVAAASATPSRLVPSFALRQPDVRAVIASTKQGMELLNLARKGSIGVKVNTPFPAGLIQVPADGTKPPTVKISPATTLRVIAPEQAEIDDLRKKWAKDLESEVAPGAAPAAFSDRSVHNLASVVFSVTQGRGANAKTMLFTGDARADLLVDAMRRQALLIDDRYHVDLFKLPHHGSFSNVTVDTFATITADHYLISANGEHDNPDVEALKALVEGRRAAGLDGCEFTLYFTFPQAAYAHITDEMVSTSSKLGHRRAALKRLHDWIEDAAPHECSVVYREHDAKGVIVDLGDSPVSG